MIPAAAAVVAEGAAAAEGAGAATVGSGLVSMLRQAGTAVVTTVSEQVVSGVTKAGERWWKGDHDAEPTRGLVIAIDQEAETDDASMDRFLAFMEAIGSESPAPRTVGGKELGTLDPESKVVAWMPSELKGLANNYGLPVTGNEVVAVMMASHPSDDGMTGSIELVDMLTDAFDLDAADLPPVPSSPSTRDAIDTAVPSHPNSHVRGAPQPPTPATPYTPPPGGQWAVAPAPVVSGAPPAPPVPPGAGATFEQVAAAADLLTPHLLVIRSSLRCDDAQAVRFAEALQAVATSVAASQGLRRYLSERS